MKQRWFVPMGWLYRPVSVPGVLIVLFAAAFCVQTFLAIDRNSHSASDTLYGVFPFFVPVFLLVNWVASNTCGESRRQ